MSGDDPMTAGAGRRATLRPGRRTLAICAALGALALSFAAWNERSSAATSAHTAAIAGLYGSLPPVGTPTKGGTISFGFTTGSTPTYIFPIVPGAQSSAYTLSEFQFNMYLPLYSGPVGATQEIDYGLSLANKPVFSDADKTVTIQMRSNYKWSNGAPVDANDLIFDIDLIKAAIKESAANWESYTPGYFPDSLASITATGKYTVVMHLKRAYNPGFFLNDELQSEADLVPLPSTDWNIASAGGPHLNYAIPANAKKIYDYLARIGGDVGSFGTNPLWRDVDGPFSLASFNATNSSFVMDANPAFGGSPKPYISKLVGETFTGITPELNALRSGSLDIFNQLDYSQLGGVSGLKAQGISVYGYPDLGWFGAFFNFKDTTDHFNSIISQLYIRQALVELEDQPAYLTGIYKNAGVLAYGPVPSVPPTAYTPADAVHSPYPYSPSAAVALLKSHGWKVVPNGQTTCAKAGSGAGECGAGIPAGTPFKFTWYYTPPSQSPSYALESEAFASEAKQAAGINIELGSKSFNYLISTFNDADPSDAKYTNDWGVNNFGGYTDDYFPTTNSIFNTTGDYNQGGYSNPTVNSLINASVYGSNPDAVTNEASFLTKNVPVLFFPNSDLLFAVSSKVGGSADSWLALTQYTTYPQYWYLNK